MADRLAAAVVDPLFYRRWYSREPMDDESVQGVVQDALSRARPQ